jgi:hypothetical protein
MLVGKDVPRDIGMRSKRRAPRMNSHVAVVIEWNGVGSGQTEKGFTRVVNNYGCLLVSPKEAELQQYLGLTNLATQQATNGVVVWKGAKRNDGWELGVEFVAFETDFWGLDL